MLIPLGETKRLSPAPALRCRVSPGAESLICPGSGYVLPPRPAQRPLGWGAAVRLGIYRVTNTPEDRWFPINLFNHVDCGSRQGCVPGGAGSGSPGVHQRSAAGDTFAAGKRRVGMKCCWGRHPMPPHMFWGSALGLALWGAGRKHAASPGCRLLLGEGRGGCRGRGG